MKFDVPFSKTLLRQEKPSEAEALSRQDIDEKRRMLISEGGTYLQQIEDFTEKAAVYLSQILQSVEILVVCGPGFNGAEGFALARLLKKYDFSVTVALDTANDLGISPEYVAERNAWHGKVYDYNDVDYNKLKLVIDCLYGSDLSSSLRGKDLKNIERLNMSSCHVISLDCPSGLNVDTGEAFGGVVKADMTITYFAKRLGFLLGEGPETTGEVVVKNHD